MPLQNNHSKVTDYLIDQYDAFYYHLTNPNKKDHGKKTIQQPGLPSH